MDQNKLMTTLKKEMKRKLGTHLKKIILFGSRSRGDHEPDSDWDILVVLDEVSPAVKDEIYGIGGEFLFDYSVVLSFLPILETSMTEKSYEPFLINALKEGVVCYESS